jgi:UDP-N-acetylglucosamine--N-acetylmuramyl-(pentapeptide) pyrophosphoryl-undecaprenol N-acetylglucosamine transferase
MAAKHAVALDTSMYPYPHDRTVHVGIPISSSYHEIKEKDIEVYRKELGLSGYKKMLFVTGGGNGAKVLNDIVKENVGYLLNRYPDLVIIHIAGRKLEDNLNTDYDELLNKNDRKRIIVKAFVDDLYRYSGAADVIVARGGATNLAEFAAQRKPCIIIPSKHLIWNVKNAESLAKQQSIIMLSEDHAEQELRLASEVSKLLDSKKAKEDLSKKFAHFYVPNAAQHIAELLFELVR